VGESPHKIAAIDGEIPREQFSASLAQETPPSDQVKKETPPSGVGPDKRTKKLKLAVVREDMWIEPESFTGILCAARGHPPGTSWYLKAHALTRKTDALIKAPDGIIRLDQDAQFLIKVANTSSQRVRV
jgi:hypothetical protein